MKEEIKNRLRNGITISLMPKTEAVRRSLAYMTIGDMAKTYSLVFDELKAEVHIPFKLLAKWDITVSELDSFATRYAPETRPYEFRKMSQIITENICKDEEDRQAWELLQDLTPENDLIWVLNYKDQEPGGASAICYPEALKEIGEKIGDAWIIPSSIHEMMVIKDDQGNMSQLEEIIEWANEQVVGEDEILSSTAYHYHAGDSEIETGWSWVYRRNEC